MAVLAALATALSYGFSNFLGGLQSRRSPLAGVVLGSQLAALIAGLPFLLMSGDSPPSRPVLYTALLAGVAQAVGLGAFYRALAIGPLSLVAPVGALGVVLPVAVGLTRGDPAGPLQITGMGAAVVGVALSSYRRDAADAERVSRSATGVALGLLAAAGFGLSFVALARASGEGLLWPANVARAAAVVAVLLVVVCLRPKLRIGAEAVPVVALAGGLNALAIILYMFATTQGLLSVVSAVAFLYPSVTVVLGLVILKERLAGAQKVGVATTLIAVVLVSSG